MKRSGLPAAPGANIASATIRPQTSTSTSAIRKIFTLTQNASRTSGKVFTISGTRKKVLATAWLLASRNWKPSTMMNCASV